jgi:hypothetical protein
MEKSNRMANGLGRKLPQGDGVIYEPHNHTNQNSEGYSEMGKKGNGNFNTKEAYKQAMGTLDIAQSPL